MQKTWLLKLVRIDAERLVSEKKAKVLRLMRKEVLLTVTAMVILGIVLFFMTQNTRFDESNLLICKHTENSFKITYAQLTEGQTISFEKNGQASKRLSLSKLKRTLFTSNTNLQNIN